MHELEHDVTLGGDCGCELVHYTRLPSVKIKRGCVQQLMMFDNMILFFLYTCPVQQ